MGGSKSSSSSSTSQYSASQQSEQSADGFIGSGANVYNLSSTDGIMLETVDQFPEGVQNLVMAMVDLVGDTVGGAASFAQDSLEKVSVRTQEATQPDLTTVKYLPYMIGGVILLGVTAIFVLGKK